MNKIIVGITLFVLAVGFYWFQIRPAEARKDCIEKYPYAFGEPSAANFTEWLNHQDDPANYEKCLRGHGLAR